MTDAKLREYEELANGLRSCIAFPEMEGAAKAFDLFECADALDALAAEVRAKGASVDRLLRALGEKEQRVGVLEGERGAVINRWAFAAIAHRQECSGVSTVFTAFIIHADNEDEANGKTLRLATERWPAHLGWKEHRVTGIAIPAAAGDARAGERGAGAGPGEEVRR